MQWRRGGAQPWTLARARVRAHEDCWCDRAVVVENDEVVDWYGWNFVDYEKTRASAGGALYPMAAVSMTTMEDTADLAHGAA